MCSHQWGLFWLPMLLVLSLSPSLRSVQQPEAFLSFLLLVVATHTRTALVML